MEHRYFMQIINLDPLLKPYLRIYQMSKTKNCLCCMKRVVYCISLLGMRAGAFLWLKAWDHGKVLYSSQTAVHWQKLGENLSNILILMTSLPGVNGYCTILLIRTRCRKKRSIFGRTMYQYSGMIRCCNFGCGRSLNTCNCSVDQMIWRLKA